MPRKAAAMRVAAEAVVPDQDLVWAAAFPEVAEEELERAAPAEVARARADQAEGVAARAAPEAEVAAELMLEICGARRGREAVAAAAQAARVDPEGVAAALAASEEAETAQEEVAQAEAARERALQVAAPAAEVAPEVAAGVARLEGLPDPAATRANG